MTGAPEPRSREAQKEELALRMTIGFPSTEATLNNAEAHIAEAEARALASQGCEPIYQAQFDGRSSVWSDVDFDSYVESEYSGYRVRALYAHPDPLLATKEAEIAELRAELDRLRKPEWFADPDDPEDGGLDIDEILDNRGGPEGEIIMLNGFRGTGQVWAFRLNGLDYQFDTEAEAVAAVERGTPDA